MSLFPSCQMKQKTRMNRLRKKKFFQSAVWLICLAAFLQPAFLTASENLLNNQPEEAVLSNGLKLIYHEDDASPTSVVQILIRGGRRREPAGKQGLAFLTTRLCLEFPNQRSIQQMMNQATRTSMFCRHDFTLIRISCLSENLEDAIKLSTQILKKPLFSGLRIERIKELMNHQRKQLDDELINVAHTAALDALFAETSYAGSDYGTEDSLENIKKKDIETFYDDYAVAGNMVVAVSTDLQKESAIEIMRPYFEEFPAGKPPDPETISFSPSEERSQFIEKDTQQSMVYLAFPLPKVSSRNYILTIMLENLLGKGVNSKLWPLRADEKLAYIVNAQSFVMREGGILEAYLETDQKKIGTAMEALKKIIRNLSEEGIPGEELEITKIHSKGSFMRESETKDDKTYNLVAFEALGLGYEFLNEVLSEMDATSLDEFNAFMKDVLNLDRAVEIIVGPEALEEQISQMP